MNFWKAKKITKTFQCQKKLEKKKYFYVDFEIKWAGRAAALGLSSGALFDIWNQFLQQAKALVWEKKSVVH